MDYQTVRLHLRGVTPLIVHNIQLADPTNPIVKEKKKLTDKRKKTDSDLEEILRLEWFGSLYLDDNRIPVIPGENVEACIRAGARKTRRGKDVEAAVFSDGMWPILYEGDKVPERLWQHLGFRKTCIVNRNKKRVLACRPIFRAWGLICEVKFMPDVVNVSDLSEWITTAGRLCGIGDWLPKFGRFEVEIG